MYIYIYICALGFDPGFYVYIQQNSAAYSAKNLKFHFAIYENSSILQNSEQYVYPYFKL